MIDVHSNLSGIRGFALAKLAAVAPADDASPEARFLRSMPALEPSSRLLDVATEADCGLMMLAEQLGLSPIEILATALAVGVETDPMIGRAVAYLQRPVGGSRPTLGLVAAAFSDVAEGSNVVGSLLAGAAIESGLLQVSNEAAPLAERVIAVPVPICLALGGVDGGRCVSFPGAANACGDTDQIALPPSIISEAEKHGRALNERLQRALTLRSGSPAEARAVASHMARSVQRQAVFVESGRDGRPLALPAGFGPWLLLCRGIPVFTFEMGPGERKPLPNIPCYRGPVLAICGPEGTLECFGETVPGWMLPVPPRSERERLWEASVGSRALAETLSVHRHGTGRIAHLGKLAHYQCALEGRDRVLLRDVAAAAWTTEGAGLEALAQPLTQRVPDEALVATSSLRDELHRLLLRCHSREGLSCDLGISAKTRYHPGVRALFCGPSGTGKTLAAGWLATQIGLPLYRVDLAAVTSKYIGETEKNLAQLLARAEHAEVVLLFDEADSMFGKRTDVKESNDRFANAQTNYLLQRIESFDGIVILTSNSQSRFDPAFFRRLDVIIEFPPPNACERRSLWQAHLGDDHLLTARELNQLSASTDLFGGNIRNAVLTAAVLGRSEQRQIAYPDVLQGLSDEYRKLGRQLPAVLANGKEPIKNT